MLLLLVPLLSHCSSHATPHVVFLAMFFSRWRSFHVVVLYMLSFLVHCHSSCATIIPTLLFLILLLSCYTSHIIPLMLQLSHHSSCIVPFTLFFMHCSSWTILPALLFLCCNSSPIVTSFAILLFSRYFFRPTIPFMLPLLSHWSFPISAHFKYLLANYCCYSHVVVLLLLMLLLLSRYCFVWLVWYFPYPCHV